MLDATEQNRSAQNHKASMDADDEVPAVCHFLQMCHANSLAGINAPMCT